MPRSNVWMNVLIRWRFLKSYYASNFLDITQRFITIYLVNELKHVDLFDRIKAVFLSCASISFTQVWSSDIQYEL